MELSAANEIEKVSGWSWSFMFLKELEIELSRRGYNLELEDINEILNVLSENNLLKD